MPEFFCPNPYLKQEIAIQSVQDLARGKTIIFILTIFDEAQRDFIVCRMQEIHRNRNWTLIDDRLCHLDKLCVTGRAGLDSRFTKVCSHGLVLKDYQMENEFRRLSLDPEFADIGPNAKDWLIEKGYLLAAWVV